MAEAVRAEATGPAVVKAAVEVEVVGAAEVAHGKVVQLAVEAEADFKMLHSAIYCLFLGGVSAMYRQFDM